MNRINSEISFTSFVNAPDFNLDRHNPDNAEAGSINQGIDLFLCKELTQFVNVEDSYVEFTRNEQTQQERELTNRFALFSI